MNEREPRDVVAVFCNRLQALEPSERARLKRNAGKTLAEASQGALGLFYRLLPPAVPPFQEETYFLVATLYHLADDGGAGDLGSALRRARREANRKGLDRRVETLLDADETQLAFRLRQVAHYLQSQRVQVNWALVLDDLLQWTHPQRYVQQRWARSYFAGPQRPDNKKH